MRLVEETAWRYRIEREGAMRVPGLVFASRELLPGGPGDHSLQQVANVATLPGIVEASYAMPDVHWGYGFPIGGVAATDVGAGGVVSPGGVGFDISCGVRLLSSPDLTLDELRPRLARVMDALDRQIPRGPGPGGVWRLRDRAELERVLLGGARLRRGAGPRRGPGPRALRGRAAPWAAPSPRQVSPRAVERGLGQVGSLGSGNHFLEVQVVDDGATTRDAARVRTGAGAGLRDDPLRLARARAPDLHRPRAA